MTREWRRQEKHGYSSFFFSAGPPPRPLFSRLFRSSYRRRVHTHRGTSRQPRALFLSVSLSPSASSARRQLLERPRISHAIHHRERQPTSWHARCRKWMRQRANLVSRLVTTRRLAFEMYIYTRYLCLLLAARQPVRVCSLYAIS